MTVVSGKCSTERQTKTIIWKNNENYKSNDRICDLLVCMEINEAIIITLLMTIYVNKYSNEW